MHKELRVKHWIVRRNDRKGNPVFDIYDINHYQDALRYALQDDLRIFNNLPDFFDIDGQWHNFSGSRDDKKRTNSDGYKIEERDNGALYVNYKSFYNDQAEGYFWIIVKKDRKDNYLEKKRCNFYPSKLRFEQIEGHFSTTVIVPIYDLDGNETGGQRIYSNGRKQNITGSKIAGSFFPVYHSDDWRDQDTIFLAEGIATAISVYEATNKPCLAIFGIGGYRSFLEQIREKAPELESRLIIAADNDKQGENPVQVPKMLKIIAGSKLRYILPHLPEDSKGTDFNDLMVACGLDEVRRQLQNIKEAPIITQDINTSFEQKNTNNTIPSNKPKTEQEQKKNADEAGDLVISGDITVRDCYFIINNRVLYDKVRHRTVDYDDIKSVMPYFNFYHENRVERIVFRKRERWCETFKEDGSRFYNAFFSHTNNNGCPHKASILHAFTVSTFPRSHEYLEEFAACLLDDPEILLNRYPVLAGPQGVGKSLYTVMLMKLLGEKNCHSTNAQTIAGRWGGQELTSKILIAGHELDIELLKRDRELLNTFNHRVGEKLISAEKKNKNEIQEHRTANFIFTTNYIHHAIKYINERRLRWVTTRATPPKDPSIFNKLAILINDQEAIDGYNHYYISKIKYNEINLRNPSLGLEDTVSVADHTPDNVLSFINSINIEDFGSIAIEDLARFANLYDENLRDTLRNNGGQFSFALNKFKNRVATIMTDKGWNIARLANFSRKKSLVNPKIIKYTHMVTDQTLPCDPQYLNFKYNTDLSDSEEDKLLHKTYHDRARILGKEHYLEKSIMEYESKFGNLIKEN